MRRGSPIRFASCGDARGQFPSTLISGFGPPGPQPPDLKTFVQKRTASVAAQLTTFPIFTRSQPGVVTAAGDGLFADSFVRTTAECLRVAVAHASMNAGARGEALARCHLILAGEPVTLGYAQFHDDFNSWKPYYPQRPLHPSATPTPGGKPRGIDTEAILRDPVEWMSATRKVLTDIFHLCGQPEVRQIDESGALNIPYWQTQLLAGWKAVAKVPRVEVNLEPR